VVVAAQAALQGVQRLSGSADRGLLPGALLALAGSIAFSGKAIIVKLAYRYGVDAVTLIMYRMLFAARPRSRAVTGSASRGWASAAITSPVSSTSPGCSTSARRWNG
jgi:hypothetical protein